MLTYDHAYRTLSNIEWISEKRKKMKENNAKYTYIDMSIPIVAGAVAGKLNLIYESSNRQTTYVSIGFQVLCHGF